MKALALKELREVFGIESGLENIAVHGNTDPGILRAVVEREGRGDALAQLLGEGVGAGVLPRVGHLEVDVLHFRDNPAHLVRYVVQPVDAAPALGLGGIAAKELALPAREHMRAKPAGRRPGGAP